VDVGALFAKANDALAKRRFLPRLLCWRNAAGKIGIELLRRFSEVIAQPENCA
jgi:hypothetical protein